MCIYVLCGYTTKRFISKKIISDSYQNLKPFNCEKTIAIAQSAGAVEYTDCFSAEG